MQALCMSQQNYHLTFLYPGSNTCHLDWILGVLNKVLYGEAQTINPYPLIIFTKMAPLSYT